MISKKKRLDACRLYLILDAQVCDHQRLWSVLQAGVNNGVDIVQLRDKLGTVQRALAFLQRAQRYLKGRVPLIVNDRADLAMAAAASGVHVGQDDLPVLFARQACGQDAIVGKSCQSIKALNIAEAEGADYVGFGSIFQTKTKPDRAPMDLKLLRAVVRRAKVPVFAIGGITRFNVGRVCACGITRVAVCRDILLARDPARAAKELKTILLMNRKFMRE
jgi:thiamine-phosphate pyrophosphorylase